MRTNPELESKSLNVGVFPRETTGTETEIETAPGGDTALAFTFLISHCGPFIPHFFI